MKEYDVNHLKLLVNGEYINLGCFVDFIKDKPINMEHYIASYKHLIGCEVYCSEKDGFFTFNENMNILSYDRFYLDDETLGTYEEYMQLHYPDYVHVWKHQL